MDMLKLDRLIDSYQQEMVQALQELVRIPSVQKDPLPNMPFGKACDDVLNAALGLAKDMGFDTVNVDGYAGHIDYGEGDKTLGILGHLDVVPEGDGWTVEPYGAIVKDGYMYGRGTTDNKCSCVGTLFALRAIKELGIPLKHKVRVILGLNEESGWADIAYYTTKYAMPDYGYSPDGPFPLVYAEKGILNVELSKTFAKAQGDYPVKQLRAGTAINVVPDKCFAVIGAKNAKALAAKLEEILAKNALEYEMELGEDEVHLTVIGKAAHGAFPSQGVNAAVMLLGVLSAAGVGQGSKDTITYLAQHMQNDGAGIDANVSDEPSGDLTMNMGIITLDESGFSARLDIRQPVTYSFNEVVGRIQAACAPAGIDAKSITQKDPLHLPLDHPIIKTLMRIYKDITGRDDKPISMGGGTYARALSNAVAFGPGFPGEAKSQGAHQRDERLYLEEWFTATKIYARAIATLAGEGVEI